MNIKRLPANLDARSDEEKAYELLMRDNEVINDWHRRVRENEERRRLARLHRKWEAA
jgi:hypothetical protein